MVLISVDKPSATVGKCLWVPGQILGSKNETSGFSVATQAKGNKKQAPKPELEFGSS